MIGTTISQYEILEKLGGGGMGVVYTARDTKLDRTVALKFLPPDLIRDEEAKERFTQEAKAASALNHANICAIHDISEMDDGQLFIVMAQYDGQTLKHRLADGPLDEAEAIQIARQLADGLSAAHEKGIVHRDIKPANIMVTEKGRAVILDFGLAKLAGGIDLTKTGSTIGTTAYMSPEQARGDTVDQQSDIWSLGAVFYEMIAGRKPFPGEYDQAVIYGILNSEPEPLDSGQWTVDNGQSGKLQRIILKALTKDPGRRYSSADEIIVDLDAIEAGGAVAGPTRPLNRNLVYASLAAIVVLIAVALAVMIPSSETGIESIAVLPLENLSGDPDQQYFVDGMTEAIITELSKIGGLKVISRQSAMRFRNSELAATEIADQLGVDALVQGAVIKEGDDVRITAHLISGTTDEHLWANSFDRELEGILKLHGEVARAIADEIEINITAEEHARLSSADDVDPRAYELYLRGRHQLERMGRDDFKMAEAYFNSALEIDPDFALAVQGLTSVVIYSRQMGYLHPDVAKARGLQLLSRVFELDSTIAEAHSSSAGFETWTNWDWEAGERAFKRTIDLNPNEALARAFYSHLLNILCRPDEAMEQIDRAVELDPLNSLIRSLYAMDLMMVGRPDEAIQQAEEVLKTSPSNFVALTAMKSAYVRKEQYEQAYQLVRREDLAFGDTGLVEVFDRAYEEGGYVFALGETANTLAARADTSFVPPFLIAGRFAKAGLDDEAFPWLERAYASRAPNMPYMALTEGFVGLHDDPRFEDLLRRMNLEVCVQ